MAKTVSQEYRGKGSRILDEARAYILAGAERDSDLWFKINRYVYARLQLDERKIKDKIKSGLGQSVCHLCGNRIRILRGSHLHRPDGSKGYSLSNAVLTHKKCHERHHVRHEPV